MKKILTEGKIKGGIKNPKKKMTQENHHLPPLVGYDRQTELFYI